MDSCLMRAVLIALISYALGNLNGAVIVSKALYHEDVRHSGSQNGGLTNFMRVFGKKAAPLVILIDSGKAVLAVLLGGYLLEDYALLMEGRALAMLFSVIGHTAPALYRFHGGKGILASISAVFVLNWQMALILMGVFFLILLLTKYVSLGSMVGELLLPLLAHFFIGIPFVTGCCALCAGLTVYMHRSNIRRLLKGEENKFHF